jgi:hypothetical protein
VLHRMDGNSAVGARALRFPREDAGWILIGTAYVHGLMNGEVLEGLTKRDKYLEQIIHLG